MKSATRTGRGIRGINVSAFLLSCGAIAVAATLEWLGSDAYMVVLGIATPVATTVAACVVGLVGLRIVERRHWCDSAGAPREGYLAALLFGALLPIPMLVVDILGGFPLALNASAPASLLFYPAIAVLAEFVFHVIPLAGVAVASAFVSQADERARKIGMALAALPEPVFQVAGGTAHAPAWVLSCVGVQVLAFNLLGLRLFQRHGFLVVYLYRLTYYAAWHILWGHLRLSLLFGR